MSIRSAIDKLRRKHLYERMRYNVNSDPDTALDILETIMSDTEKGSELRVSLRATSDYLLELGAYAKYSSNEPSSASVVEFLKDGSLLETVSESEMQKDAAKAIKSLEEIHDAADHIFTTKGNQIAVPREVLNDLVTRAKRSKTRSANERVNNIVWPDRECAES